jgi:hypothetical protein
MPNFTDTEGRVWPLSITYASCKKILAECDVNILDVASIDQTIGRLRLDNLLVGDIVLCLCAQECRTRGLSLDDLRASLDGEALDQASNALLEGLAAFFRRGQKGQLLTEMIQKMKALEETATQQALKDITGGTLGMSGALDTGSLVSST